MSRITINLVYLVFACGTAFFAVKSDAVDVFWVLFLAAPVLVDMIDFKRRMNVFVITARAFMPVIVGLFFVSFYHHFPDLIQDPTYDELRRVGITGGEKPFDRSALDVSGIFVNSLTVLYAITVAFLLLKGLNDFDELKGVLHEEGNEINNIANYALFFEQNEGDDENKLHVRSIIRMLREYAENFTRSSQISVSVENEDVLQKLIFVVGKLNPLDKNDNIALAEVMKSLARLSEIRSRRIVCIEKEMSPYLLTVILLMSIAMVMSFFASSTGKFSIEYVYVFLLPAFYASIFMTLIDLSSPFDGYWSIKLRSIEHVKEKLLKFEASITHPSSTPK